MEEKKDMAVEKSPGQPGRGVLRFFRSRSGAPTDERQTGLNATSTVDAPDTHSNISQFRGNSDVAIPILEPEGPTAIGGAFTRIHPLTAPVTTPRTEQDHGVPPTKEEIDSLTGEESPLTKAAKSKLGMAAAAVLGIPVGLAGTHLINLEIIPGIYQAAESALDAYRAPVTASGIPSFVPSIPSENITPTATGKSPQELAKEAGYNILWMDPNDTTGRTVFYDFKGGWDRGIGESYGQQNGTDGKVYRYLVSLTGQFVGFEDIEGSKDKYIILKNPKTGELFRKIRVDYEGKIFTTEGMKPTGLGIENLSYNTDQALSIGVNGRLGFLPQWDKVQLRKILQPGDAVGIGVTAVKGISANVLHEKDNVVTAMYEPYFAGGIDLRRFGGKAQIERELASP